MNVSQPLEIKIQSLSERKQQLEEKVKEITKNLENIKNTLLVIENQKIDTEDEDSEFEKKEVKLSDEKAAPVANGDEIESKGETKEDQRVEPYEISSDDTDDEQGLFVNGFDNHSFFVDENGCIWGWGNNGTGQLGLGDLNPRDKPEKIENLPKISTVFAFVSQTFFLDVEKSVWACGENNRGQLGIGFKSPAVCIPTKIDNLPKISSIFSGGDYFFFLDETRSVWGCGYNKNGGLGFGDCKTRLSPEKIEGLPKIETIVCSYNHAFFLDAKQAVWACGSNKFGELGIGNQSSTRIPKLIEALPTIKQILTRNTHTLFLDTSGDIWASGNYSETNSSTPVQQKFNVAPQIIQNELSVEFEDEIDVQDEIDNFSLNGMDIEVDFETLRMQFYSGETPFTTNPELEVKDEKFRRNVAKLNTAILVKENLITECKHAISQLNDLVQGTEESIQQLRVQQEPITKISNFLARRVSINNELLALFTRKLSNPSRLTVDEVSLFLNLCDLKEFIQPFKDNKMDGSMLLDFSQDSDLKAIGKFDLFARRKYQFNVYLLYNGLFFNQKHIKNCIVCNNSTPESLLKLLKEFQLNLSESIIKQHSITTPQLILFSRGDLNKIFGLSPRECVEVYQKLASLREHHLL